ncbi:MAG: domain S-box protein, partial [Verrucomicrobiales bacterium]|nr:domain S-box protein [Verrucomicrobiales bacterium]
MKILIVDDIPTNRKLLRVNLEGEGHLVVEAADGREALKVLYHETIDAVISDILMPNMDGFRLCQEIRASEKLRATPFVIYTSTYTSARDQKLAESIGADCYLTKPSPLQAILSGLNQAVLKAAQRSATVQ